jgi:hypothetical protein
MSSSQSGADIEEDTAGEVTKPPIQASKQSLLREIDYWKVSLPHVSS